MTDKIADTEQSQAASGTTPTLDNSPGSQLRRAREQAGISLPELARCLCMTCDKLEWLERDEYELLPAPIYVRGYIRNASKELGIDPGPVLQAYSGYSAAEQQSRAIVEHVRRGPVVETRKSHLTWLPLLLVAGAIYWFYGRDMAPDAGYAVEAVSDLQGEFGAAPAEPGPSATLPQRDSPEASTAVVASTDRPLAEPDTGTVPGGQAQPPLPDEPESAVLPVTSTSAEDLPAPASTEARLAPPAGAESGEVGPLQLRFAEEAWIEVRDATGAVLLAKLQAAGSRLSLQGTPPFQLMLGNAAATEVRYLGELIASDPIGGRRTRRLTVGE
ncbi:RodZ domain-containing protein [Microbulbifer sp. TYP-18]|uniref:RodZ domain-containing protein n=1 Tax=Microbulbifer sp. TYP-18 TaxID=3230024 RepID=UPI0034C60133